jgi:hypothetical protein
MIIIVRTIKQPKFLINKFREKDYMNKIIKYYTIELIKNRQ